MREFSRLSFLLTAALAAPLAAACNHFSIAPPVRCSSAPDIIRYLVSTAAATGNTFFPRPKSGFYDAPRFFCSSPQSGNAESSFSLAAYLQPRHAFSMHVPVPFTTPLPPPLVSIGYREGGDDDGVNGSACGIGKDGARGRD